MDEHPRSRHAEARVDDARDLLDVERRRGKRPAADARAAALHGLRRDPGTGPARLPSTAGRTRSAGALDAAGGWNWTYWERVLEPLVREISAEPARPGAQEPGDDARAPNLRSLGPSDFTPWPQRRALGDRGAGVTKVSRRHDRWAPGCSERLRLRREPVGADRRWRAGGQFRPLVRSRVPPDGVGGAFQLIVCHTAPARGGDGARVSRSSSRLWRAGG